jgi:hypothetical protein
MASPQKPTEGLLFDLRRKAQLTNAGPADHAGKVVVGPMEIDLEKTIFKTADEGLKPMACRAMFGTCDAMCYVLCAHACGSWVWA